VSRITPAGAMAGGTEYQLDCIIYATGFDFLVEYNRESGFDIFGEDGLALSEHWREGPRTLYGLLTDKFQNLFFLRLAQAGHAANYTQTAEEQTGYIGYVIGEALARDAATVEASTAAVDGWVGEVIEMAAPRQQFLASCTPGHYNYEGDVTRQRFALLNELYGGGAVAYFELLRIMRAERDVEGLDFSAAPPV
jgi:cyclohexanone monooxygenase